jgi:selenocysteine lyase/cysteine desulfurase
VSFKHLFSKSLAATPERLHLAAHSHHLWPDASFQGQVQCWEDAARLADSKWDKVMGEIWPEAQGHVARELGSDLPDGIVFAPNTHDFLIRIASAAPRQAGAPLRILTSSGEFHSARRQFARWAESGDVLVTQVEADPFEGFVERFAEEASTGTYDLIFVSQMLFASGRFVDVAASLARMAAPGGPWVVLDGYHAFMAVPQPLGREAAKHAFYTAGGYKYAMAGEGCAFLHAPPGFGSRPAITGWYAEFDELNLVAGRIGYASDARRFMGSTFDPSGLYRFNAVQRMLCDHNLDTGTISNHVQSLQLVLLEGLPSTPFCEAELLNPLNEESHARFVALRSSEAQRWCGALKERGCITDVRGDVLRIGFGLYHDEPDVADFLALARSIG